MDSGKFESLMRRHKDSVYRQMVRVCGNADDAEDALGQAMLLAFQAADQLESPDRFRGWVATIGTRVCSRMRHHASFQQVLDEVENRGWREPRAITEFDMPVLKSCVRDAIARLPETYRLIYQLCEIEEEPVAEAAAKIGISHAAAKSRLLRAREFVRKELDASICGE